MSTSEPSGSLVWSCLTTFGNALTFSKVMGHCPQVCNFYAEHCSYLGHYNKCYFFLLTDTDIKFDDYSATGPLSPVSSGKFLF